LPQRLRLRRDSECLQVLEGASHLAMFHPFKTRWLPFL